MNWTGPWMKRAACLGLRDETGRAVHDVADRKNRVDNDRAVIAKAVCATCPVLDDCTACALTSTTAMAGFIVAGMTPREVKEAARAPEWRERRLRDSQALYCGTPRGFRSHVELNEPACRACRENNALRMHHIRPSRANA